MLRILSAVPKLTVTALIILAIVNLLVGVILRYFVGAITDWLDVDPVFLRVAFILLALLFGLGIVVYIVLWLFVPRAPATPASKA